MTKHSLIKGRTAPIISGNWTLNCKFGADLCAPARILLLENNERTVLAIIYKDGKIEAEICFSYSHNPLNLSAYPQEIPRDISITYTGSRIALSVDGVLWDEEWPIGEPVFYGAVCTLLEADFVLHEDVVEPGTVEPGVITGLDGWRPEGHNTGAGDCMPFYHDGVYHLFYLFDRRSHKSKWGLGAHQWAHVSSRDLLNWKRHPLAVAIDSQSEGSICTGSVIYHDGMFWAFYSVRMSDKSPAGIAWATSTDCISFTKTYRYFTLPEPYEGVSARDPCVFKSEDGLFHMLVTTSIRDGVCWKGALAHLTSNDLEQWRPQPPFLIWEGDDQPECADYFLYNGWYYLVYSIRGVAYYEISKEPFTGFTKSENNIIGHDKLRVPKRAFFGEGRIIFAGFVAATPDGYGGTIQLLEAFQNTGGSLCFQPLR